MAVVSSSDWDGASAFWELPSRKFFPDPVNVLDGSARRMISRCCMVMDPVKDIGKSPGKSGRFTYRQLGKDPRTHPILLVPIPSGYAAEVLVMGKIIENRLSSV
jgi:hypothetical protein